MKSKTVDSNAAENADGEVRADDLKDPMSGYASADALGSESIESGVDRDDSLRDPMSGYSSADALETGSSVNEAEADKAHPDEMQDAMSGYASADTLEPEQK
jgi:hypothetical protein